MSFADAAHATFFSAELVALATLTGFVVVAISIHLSKRWVAPDMSVGAPLAP